MATNDLSEQFEAAAKSIGLMSWIREREVDDKPMFAAIVAREADDWSMTPTEIAMARNRLDAQLRGIDAIRQMAPQIARKIDAASAEPPDTRIAAGIGADGVVTALRVERDGTVRLSPEDIVAIVQRVGYEALPDGVKEYADQARYMLGLLQWRRPPPAGVEDNHCPRCNGSRDRGHKADCDLALLL